MTVMIYRAATINSTLEIEVCPNAAVTNSVASCACPIVNGLPFPSHPRFTLSAQPPAGSPSSQSIWLQQAAQQLLALVKAQQSAPPIVWTAIQGLYA